MKCRTARDASCVPLTSIRFIVFSASVLAVYNLVPARHRSLVLLVASYGFYAGFSVAHLLVLGVVTLVAFVAGTFVSTRQRYALPLSIVAVALPLLAFKYYDFLTELLAAVAQFSHAPVADLRLPVGISFFTFQAISYLVDVHRGDVPPERSLARLALYLAFFPKLLAGPIERAGVLGPQLSALARTTAINLHSGAKVALWGFFCKLVIADNLASIVDRVLKAPQEQSGATLSAAFALYAVQIYFDFLGYTNIAVGVARCFNIRLNPNFNVPYAATSLRDFWRRWHISLSSWFRDYVYVPLGGNRTRGIKRAGQLLVVFTLSGLWHGAELTFVAWGAFHGFAYAAEDQLRRLVAGRLTSKPGWSRPLLRSGQCILTFVVVTFGWVFFRSADLSAVRVVIERIALLNRDVPYWAINEVLTRTDSAWFVSLALGALALDGSRGFRAVLDRDPKDYRELLGELAYVNSFAVAIGLLGDLGVRDFTYFRF